MAHLVDKEFVERANTVLLLGILWTGLERLELGKLIAIRRRIARDPRRGLRVFGTGLGVFPAAT